MTTELERIKILEEKIAQVVETVKKLSGENDRLKDLVKELRAEKKEAEEAARKAGRLDESLKRQEEERAVLREKIEVLIRLVDQLGL
ncbi:MAG: cell division protein ZapB [Candidatus Aminicenantes bacterium]|nr:cell division protein ZapB [Candidatus Aminicenantes bacterium]